MLGIWSETKKLWNESWGDNMLNWEEREDEVLKLRSGRYMSCSECGTVNEKSDNYCSECGHKLKEISKYDKNYKEYCPVCKEPVTEDMNYCGSHGHKIIRNKEDKRCPVCGEWVVDKRYCINCGHDFYRSNIYSKNRKFHQGDILKKKCPNCNAEQKESYHYCEYCGTKLENRKRRW